MKMALAERSSTSEWPPQLTPLEEENALIDKDIAELRQIYDREMKDYSPGKRHSKVIVLLLYWDKVANSYLDTREEVRIPCPAGYLTLTAQVEQLGDMFEKNFRYTVHKKSLNAVPGRAAKVLLQKYIGDVVLDIDEPNSLLIIYYAGHGNPVGENGDTVLTG